MDIFLLLYLGNDSTKPNVMGKGETSKHYAENPESAEQHRKYQREYNKSEKAKKSRAEDNKARRDLGLKKGDPRDASRKTRVDENGKLISFFTPEHHSKNRGSKSNQPGDKRARGKKS